MHQRKLSRWQSSRAGVGWRGLPVLAGVLACGAGGVAAGPAAQAAPGPAAPVAGAVSSSADLNAVSAVSATSAWAVGLSWASSPAVSQSLIERWNGTSWAKVPSPSPGTFNQLNGVSSVSASSAWAVGMSTSSTGTEKSLILQWNGTSWKQMPSPSPGGTAGMTVLAGVSARSASDAWAVGFYRISSSGNLKSLILHWNGTSWKQVPSPDPGGTANFAALDGVSADSAGDAWAVGIYTASPGGRTLPLTVRWNGTSWKQVPSPAGSGSTKLAAVSAVSATNAWAVGFFGVQSATLHWNGTSWKQVPSPSPSMGANDLNAVAVTGTTAWAVGSDSTTSGGSASLTARWNGTTWSQVPSPSPAGSTGLTWLAGVSATSATSAWAVGYDRGHAGGTDQTVILRWNGTAWTRVPSPS